MQLFIDDNPKEIAELTVRTQNGQTKLTNTMILYKLLTNMIGYLHAKY